MVEWKSESRFLKCQSTGHCGPQDSFKCHGHRSKGLEGMLHITVENSMVYIALREAG